MCSSEWIKIDGLKNNGEGDNKVNKCIGWGINVWSIGLSNIQKKVIIAHKAWWPNYGTRAQSGTQDDFTWHAKPKKFAKK